MSLTAEDLATIKRKAKHLAFKQGSPSLSDDFVSESCVRLLATALPSESDHRRRFINQTVSWAAADFQRKNSVTPRRIVAKLKRGENLSRKEQVKVGRVESVDFSQDWLKHIAAPGPAAGQPDVRRALAEIGHRNPVEFFVLTMHYLHEQPLKHIGDLLGVTESRACQLCQAGIEAMRCRIGATG